MSDIRPTKPGSALGREHSNYACRRAELRTDGEDVLPTRHPQIAKLRGLEVDEQWLEEGLRQLKQVLVAGNSDQLRELLISIETGQGCYPIQQTRKLREPGPRRFN